MAKEDEVNGDITDEDVGEWAIREVSLLKERQRPRLRHLKEVGSDEDLSDVAGWLVHVRFGNPFERSHGQAEDDFALRASKPAAILTCDFMDDARWLEFASVYQRRTGVDLYDLYPITGLFLRAHAVLEPLSQSELDRQDLTQQTPIVLSPVDMKQILAR